MTDNLRAELAQHHAKSMLAPGGWTGSRPCMICGLVWPCDASRARAALDTADQERDEAKSQVAALREALTEINDAVVDGMSVVYASHRLDDDGPEGVD